MRQVVLDTETTGLEVEQKHRVIEIGCVELVNRRLTGRTFHQYLNPQRDIDEGAQQVHGLTRERLAKEPIFSDISNAFVEFVRDAELIIHNAPFDVTFLNAELRRIGDGLQKMSDLCSVLDTLSLARQMHPGQRNSLDALCKRYSVDNSHREYHGALLDARILAEVYLGMTGGQAKLVLDTEAQTARKISNKTASARPTARLPIPVVMANEAELAAHEYSLQLLDKASGGKTVWRRV